MTRRERRLQSRSARTSQNRQSARPISSSLRPPPRSRPTASSNRRRRKRERRRPNPACAGVPYLPRVQRRDGHRPPPGAGDAVMRLVRASPMTGAPTPAVSIVRPMSGMPDRAGIRSGGIISVRPNVAISVPAPISPDPIVVRSGCPRNDLVNRRRRSRLG